MNTCKSYKVIIFGQEYTLATDEAEQHVLQAAESVDALMNVIAEHSKMRDGQKIAVLAALRLSSMVCALERQLQELKDNEQRCIAVIDHELTSSETTAPAHGSSHVCRLS